MLILQLVAIEITVWVSVYRHFGALDAFAVTGAIYLLMPYRMVQTLSRDVTPR